MPKLQQVVVALAVATCITGCKKSSEIEQKEPSATRERDRAAVEAQEESEKVRKAAADEHHEYLAAVRREQLELRGRVQEAIDDLDGKLHALKVDAKDADAIDPKSKEGKKVLDLLGHRRRLEVDLGRIERSDERGWDETKAEIERDIGGPSRLPGKI